MRPNAIDTLLPALLAAAPAAAQPDTAEPAREAPDPAVKKRVGGFHGIWFTEARRDGRTVLEIKAVLEGSDAERLGYRKGDLITGVEGKPLKNGDDFIRKLYLTVPEFRRRMGPRAGDAPETSWIDIVRDGEARRIEGGLLELDATPKVGDPAPDFTLRDPTGKRPVSLSGLRGRPVVLVFGSYT